MKSIIKIILSLLVILFSFSVHAKLIKCTDSKGAISYSTSPCLGDKDEIKTVATKNLQKQLEREALPEVKDLHAKKAQDSADRHEQIVEASRPHVKPVDPMQQMQAQIAAQNAQMQGQIAAQNAQMRSQMHRMENQQRMNIAFPPMR